MALPPPLNVQDSLLARGYSCQVIEHTESTHLSGGGDRRLRLGQITKSMIKGKTTQKPIRPHQRCNCADERRISQYAGEPIGRLIRSSSVGHQFPLECPHWPTQPMETYLMKTSAYDTIWVQQAPERDFVNPAARP
jgi:hypothetical protein